MLIRLFLCNIEKILYLWHSLPYFPWLHNHLPVVLSYYVMPLQVNGVWAIIFFKLNLDSDNKFIKCFYYAKIYACDLVSLFVCAFVFIRNNCYFRNNNNSLLYLTMVTMKFHTSVTWLPFFPFCLFRTFLASNEFFNNYFIFLPITLKILSIYLLSNIVLVLSFIFVEN